MQEEQAKKPTKKFRYYCPHCTERAIYAVAPYVFLTIICRNCEKVVEYDDNNWFEITDEKELAKVNA